MYDTISAMIETRLDADLFTGGQVKADFETGEEWSRLWRNPSDDEYGPRYTYWSDGGALKVEVSLPKLIDADNSNSYNMSEEDKEHALDVLNLHIRSAFGDLPDVRSWRCQRVDYCWNWQVDEPEWYVAIYGQASPSGASKQVYGHGVVWKKRRRWVKLYDKRKEAGGGDGLLRLEVSNYRQAVQYMCDRWFGSGRTVADVLQAGRALFVLGVEYERLNMHVPISSEAGLLRRMRLHYGASVSGAWYALAVLRRFGPGALTLDLMSEGSYYTWRKRLAADGFLVVQPDRHLLNSRQDVTRLHLPVMETVRKGKNLEASPAAPGGVVLKNSARNSDAEEVLKAALGVVAGPPQVLMIAFLDGSRSLEKTGVWE